MAASDDKVNILLVDDRQENLLGLEAVLNRLGHHLVKVTSGEEALGRLLDDDFAVILLDVQMPGMDGFETAALIRARDRSRATPIIFITANSRTDGNVSKGYALGAVDYIFKPIVPDILRSKVGAFVDLFKMTAEVKRLNAHLRRRTAELEETNDILESFTYTVAHDLRAPLRAITGFARILMDECASELSGQALHYLHLVRESAQEMGHLVDDLLTFSRTSRKALSKRRVDLRQLCHQALSQLETDRAGRQVEIKIGDLGYAEGDPTLLDHVFVNLLSNALKFTRMRQPAIIEVGNLEGDPPTYFVKDNGVGFDMRYVDKLFGVFQRLHRAEEFEGTGVGLAIVQRIIQRHGGRVWAEGAEGLGATFYFTLEEG